MPRNHTKKWSYNKASLESAVRDVLSGSLSLKMSATKYGVPPSTIGNHLCRRGYVRKKRSPSAMSVIDQEVLGWLKSMEKINCSFVKNQLSEIVSDVFRRHEHKGRALSGRSIEQWTEQFLKTHQMLPTDLIQKGSSKREVTSEDIDDWFTKREHCVREYHSNSGQNVEDLLDNSIYCCFELGFVYQSGEKDVPRLVYKNYSNNKKEESYIMSIYCCISAGKMHLKPLLIIRDDKFDITKIKADIQNFHVLSSCNGEMQLDVVMLWLQLIETEIRGSSVSGSVMMYLDQSIRPLSHSSLEYCIQKDLLLFYLPGQYPKLKPPIGMDIFLSWNHEFDRLTLSHKCQDGQYSLSSILNLLADSWHSMLAENSEACEMKEFGLMPLNRDIMKSTYEATFSVSMSADEAHFTDVHSDESTTLSESINKNVTIKCPIKLDDEDDTNIIKNERSYDDTEEAFNETTDQGQTIESCNDCSESKQRGLRCGIVHGLIFALKKMEAILEPDTVSTFKSRYISNDPEAHVSTEPSFIMWYKLMKCLEMGPNAIHEKHLDNKRNCQDADNRKHDTGQFEDIKEAVEAPAEAQNVVDSPPATNPLNYQNAVTHVNETPCHQPSGSVVPFRLPKSSEFPQSAPSYHYIQGDYTQMDNYKNAMPSRSLLPEGQIYSSLGQLSDQSSISIYPNFQYARHYPMEHETVHPEMSKYFVNNVNLIKDDCNQPRIFYKANNLPLGIRGPGLYGSGVAAMDYQQPRVVQEMIHSDSTAMNIRYLPHEVNVVSAVTPCHFSSTPKRPDLKTVRNAMEQPEIVYEAINHPGPSFVNAEQSHVNSSRYVIGNNYPTANIGRNMTESHSYQFPQNVMDNSTMNFVPYPNDCNRNYQNGRFVTNVAAGDHFRKSAEPNQSSVQCGEIS